MIKKLIQHCDPFKLSKFIAPKWNKHIIWVNVCRPFHFRISMDEHVHWTTHNCTILMLIYRVHTHIQIDRMYRSDLLSLTKKTVVVATATQSSTCATNSACVQCLFSTIQISSTCWMKCIKKSYNCATKAGCINSFVIHIKCK